MPIIYLKMRIDKFLCVTGKFPSRTKAAQALKEGRVTVNGAKVTASYEVNETDRVEVLSSEESFVSNGGYKLSKALKDFGFSAEGKIFADIGASNGGFTDCLLQNGAKKVYCIDVGESQLDNSLKDKSVVIIDNFNARYLDKKIFLEELDGVVVDVSFISLTYILDGISGVLSDGKHLIALIKPQFELDGRTRLKNGILNDKTLHKKIIEKIFDYAEKVNLAPRKLTNAPIKEGKNKEYLALFEKGGKNSEIKELFKGIIL